MNPTDEVKSAYEYVFNGSQGDEVMADLRRFCRVDDVMIGESVPSDREILVHATLVDVFNYINQMADGRGE
jgi:hypothetical protein